MAQNLDHVLSTRLHRVPRSQQATMFAVSVGLHVLLTVVAILVPRWLKPPPEHFEFVAVMVVPPKALGIEEPPPPPPRKKQAPPAKPEPARPEPAKPEPKKAEPKKPEPKPLDPDVPILPSKKPPPKAAAQPVAPALPPPAAPARPAEPAKRKGSPFGNPFGSSTSSSVLGVEDPNFTYGYYLDRMLALIDQNWSRPPVGSEIKEARLYFRIQRDGKLKDLRLLQTSGSDIFDQAALRAVESSSPLPPLPTSYAKDELGIQLIVK